MRNKAIVTESEIESPAKKSRGWVWLLVLLVIVLVALGAYSYILFNAPQRTPLTEIQQASFLEAQGFDTNRLIIPKISVSEEIFSGDASVLKKGIWHRFPERGDPQEEGNTILAGEGYVFAWLPQKVVSQSRLYNLNKLQAGDAIYVNWNGKQYEYVVEDKKQVSTNDTSYDAVSSNAKLTLYTSTANGKPDGQVLLIARPKN